MRLALSLSMLCALPVALAAQARPGRPATDTARADTSWNPEPLPGGGMADGPQDPMRAAQLRVQIEERFGNLVKTDLALSDQDMGRVRTAMRSNQDRRIAIGRREQDLRLAMARQMQPGQAADADSVQRMTEAMSRLRVERAQSDDQLVHDLGFLPPVKRARLLFMMQRFEQQVQEIRRRTLEGAGGTPMRPNRPGMRPGMRGRLR